jgi:hypothetical protein
VLYTAYVFGRSVVQGRWVTVHSGTLLAFVLPSLVFLVAWIFRTDLLLRDAGGDEHGSQYLFAGAAIGALAGALSGRQGWTQGSALDDALIGVAVGIAVVAFVLLPWQYQRIASSRDWRDPWVTWRDGLVPTGFAVAGVYLLHRATTVNPPGGWPVAVVAAVCVIAWLQWVAAVQSACNELWLGPVEVGEERLIPPSRVDDHTPTTAPVGGGFQV